MNNLDWFEKSLGLANSENYIMSLVDDDSPYCVNPDNKIYSEKQISDVFDIICSENDEIKFMNLLCNLDEKRY